MSDNERFVAFQVLDEPVTYSTVYHTNERGRSPEPCTVRVSHYTTRVLAMTETGNVYPVSDDGPEEFRVLFADCDDRTAGLCNDHVKPCVVHKARASA